MKNLILNAYDRLAASGDYQRNENNLRLTQIAVITVSAAATGIVNAFAHKDRIGWLAAVALAVAIAGFVEKFFFTLRHGLTTVYKSGKQRFAAQICYKAIQVTMILNVALLTSWLVGFETPAPLLIWNHWSVAIHFGLALVGVTAVRDSDAVIQNRMLELKAETARQDVITIRRAAALGNSIVLISAKVRGWFDAFGLAYRLVRSGERFGERYLQQINEITRVQFSHLETTAIPPASDRPPAAQIPPAGSYRRPNVRIADASAQVRAPGERGHLVAGKGSVEGSGEGSVKGSVEPPEKGSVEGSVNPAKLGSGTGFDLAEFPSVKFEPHKKGGFEAWHVPPGAKKRSEKTYVGYLGMKRLEMFSAGDFDRLLGDWLREKLAEKGIDA